MRRGEASELRVAGGAATLAVFHGTAFWVSYLLGSVGGVILAAVMLRSAVFGKTTAYVRIASSGLDFGLFVPTIGLFISLVSVVCLLAINVLVARRLLQLARGQGKHGVDWRAQIGEPAPRQIA